ncbi:MAG: GtrA family protein [Dactylosporangium sp.]|nr:GtrA family protein [Dactylosporangium sp.]NNJ63731.1 GtrA family protein [Dactylosporangium sp.]
MSFATSISRIGQHSATKFATVGGLSLVADAGSLFVFHGLLGIWLPAATTLAYVVAFVVNFGLNRLWAFESSSAVGRQLWLYLALVMANLVVTVGLVQGLTLAGLPYLVAKLVTAGGLAVVNYGISRKWIFV